MRKLVLGEYDTGENHWTLAACKIYKGEQVQTFVEIPARYAPLDFSTILTDGQPYYSSATLEAVLESSEGDHSERQARIDELVNYADGHNFQIIHPDHLDHYLVGRVQVQPDYNDLAHCAVLITAVCEPWLYASSEKVLTLAATQLEKTAKITNAGRLARVPKIVITGEVTLKFGAFTWTLSAGEHILPDLYLTPGAHEITYRGSGTLTVTYREAVLAA